MEEDQIIPEFKVLLIGGSAGSLDVLMKILPKLPRITAFAMVIVLHRKSSEDTTLEELIAMKTPTPVMEVEDKVLLQPGFIYVAPSDYHLLFEKNHLLSLDISEKIHYSRPSIDVAFESAAEAYGSLVTAMLLSGANADGTAGLIAVKEAKGTTVIQQPDTAEIAFMPENAQKFANPDHILNIPELLSYIIAMDGNWLQ
ncbi:MAG TPA: chemotaxis protein CheB [Flavobacterium sp.]|nr:chemotaxis protein CheB [Flavobacterium sp.]